eukprot:797886-Amphidinium_carterae.2
MDWTREFGIVHVAWCHGHPNSFVHSMFQSRYGHCTAWLAALRCRIALLPTPEEAAATVDLDALVASSKAAVLLYLREKAWYGQIGN